jgi:preprotein translocase subunit SecG
MFLYTLLVTLFVFLCLIIIPLILIQKGKSSMGLGNLGGGTQLLFGGSGGQDLFQKTTWVLTALFMGGSLILAMMNRPTSSELLGNLAQTQVPVMPPAPPTPQ